MDANQAAQATELWTRCEAGQLSLLSLFEQNLQERCGMGYLWFRVLDNLAPHPDGLRLQDLAESVFHSQSGTTRLVDRLAKEGLLVRRNCQADRRVVYAVLTEAGRARHGEAKRVWDALVGARFWDKLDPAQRRALAEIGQIMREAGAQPLCPQSLGA